MMKLRTLIAAAVAAAFALPLSAQTTGDKAASGSSADATAKPSTTQSQSIGGSSAASGSASAGASSKAADAMFKDLDKNTDGFVSREEAKGSPHEMAFDKFDKNADGKLSESELAAMPMAEKSMGGMMSGGSSGATTAPSDTGSSKK